MCPEQINAIHNRQRGFGMPMVVFILVIMTLLAAAMVRLTTTGTLSIASEVQSTRAFYAAESGAQWAVNALFPPAGGAGACAATTPLAFAVGGLNGCSATVTCLAQGSFNGNIHYLITSTGNCGNEVRQIQVGARQ